MPEKICPTDDQQIERLLASCEDASLSDESVKRILDTFAKLDGLSETSPSDSHDDDDATGNPPSTPGSSSDAPFSEIAIDTNVFFNDTPPSLWPRTFLPLIVGIATVSLILGVFGFISLQNLWNSQNVGKSLAVTAFCSADCQWEGFSKTDAARNISEGKQVQIKSGQVDIEFDSGTKVKLEGPARFQILSQSQMKLERGRMIAVVSIRGIGFTVDTPAARVIDLGTEFGLDVTPANATDVHVLSGKVEVHKLDAQGNELDASQLVAGEAMRVTQGAEKPLVMQANPNHFRTMRPDCTMIRDKTLVAWVCLANTSQRGGSVLTLSNGRLPEDRFDGIVYAEMTPFVWMSGSNYWRRTEPSEYQWNRHAETAASDELVQIAIAYRGRTVTIYRNGELYSEHEVDWESPTFMPGSIALLGMRHRNSSQVQDNNFYFAGEIEEARVYDVPLSQEEIQQMVPNATNDISTKPLACWTFENGSLEDEMGAFQPGKLCNGASTVNGRLILDGVDDFFVATLGQK